MEKNKDFFQQMKNRIDYDCLFYASCRFINNMSPTFLFFSDIVAYFKCPKRMKETHKRVRLLKKAGWMPLLLFFFC